ncbi:hypothetical protein N0V82_006698 [Gnomoniopsis sp. IMI 355080]|nr:hypothetical protein N0V82_006698 [Gnomoniopsis sp. IMI 355080]
MASSTDDSNAPISPGDIINVPDVSRAFQARKQWIIHERIYAVQAYAFKSKRAGGILPETVQTREWLQRIDGLLKLHEYDFEISPRMRDEAAVDAYLKILFDDERFHFPQEVRDRARALYEEYESCNWTAASEDVEDESSDTEGSPPAGLDGSDDTAATAAGNAATQQAAVKLPPRTDPIWGLQGIMHGVAPKFGKNKTFVLDRRYLKNKRSANVFGHNGLEPGAWFPNQLVALFHGAHGARIGGIHGKTGVGAYSVVVSGTYKEVDKDDGDTIIYSGPNSQNNTDPLQIPKKSAQILAHSLPSTSGPGHPVRVFRSASSHHASPAVGIRYDGLYQIEKRLSDVTNAKGGLYPRFVLRRVPGQEALSSIWARSPTLQQKRDHARMWDLRF